MAFTWSDIQVLPAILIAGLDTETTGATQAASARMPSGWTPASYTIGTGASSANKCHYGVVPLAGSAVTVDLTAMAFGFGDASIAKVKGMLIQNLTTTSGYKITVGNAAATQFLFSGLSAATTTIEVEEGGAFLYFTKTANGHTTTSKTLLKLDPGANTVSCFLAVWGE
jgi:hypothetical protein